MNMNDNHVIKAAIMKVIESTKEQTWEMEMKVDVSERSEKFDGKKSKQHVAFGFKRKHNLS